MIRNRWLLIASDIVVARKPHETTQPGLQDALDRMIEPTARGSPTNPLRWTIKSTYRLADKTRKQGYAVSATSVRLLVAMTYSLQSNRKTREGSQYPDRDGQFRHISDRVKARKRRGEPALSVDTKKKEVLGNLKNAGKTYRPQGDPVKRWADEAGLIVEDCHYPPETSKWNKIEHRVFCHITRNWQGMPLETLEIVVESSAATTTETGLEVHAWLDEGTYENGREVNDQELAECMIKRHAYHGEWNYEIHPRSH